MSPRSLPFGPSWCNHLHHQQLYIPPDPATPVPLSTRSLHGLGHLLPKFSASHFLGFSPSVRQFFRSLLCSAFSEIQWKLQYDTSVYPIGWLAKKDWKYQGPASMWKNWNCFALLVERQNVSQLLWKVVRQGWTYYIYMSIFIIDKN
jgi:hypothetical protein